MNTLVPETFSPQRWGNLYRSDLCPPCHLLSRIANVGHTNSELYDDHSGPFQHKWEDEELASLDQCHNCYAVYRYGSETLDVQTEKDV